MWPALSSFRFRKVQVPTALRSTLQMRFSPTRQTLALALSAPCFAQPCRRGQDDQNTIGTEGVLSIEYNPEYFSYPIIYKSEFHRGMKKVQGDSGCWGLCVMRCLRIIGRAILV